MICDNIFTASGTLYFFITKKSNFAILKKPELFSIGVTESFKPIRCEEKAKGFVILKELN